MSFNFNNVTILNLTTVNIIQMYKLSVLICFLVVQGVCWWQLGHMATAQVAKNRLEQLNQTTALSSFTRLIQAFNNLTDGKSNTFVQASVWADDIKEYGVSYFDSYHFTNIVYDPDYLFSSMSDFQKDVNSVNIVGSCMSVLNTNKQGVTFQRAFMARYLSHVVGDIHQPLHSTNMFNKTLPKGDLGGNLINILTKDGKAMNLHAFLDSMAGEQQDGERLPRPLDDIAKVRIGGLAGSIMKQYPPQYFGDKIDSLDAHQWSVESFEAAKEKIYPFVFQHKQATEQWTKIMYDMCRQRVALGGYRLANAIAKIYAK